MLSGTSTSIPAPAERRTIYDCCLRFVRKQITHRSMSFETGAYIQISTTAASQNTAKVHRLIGLFSQTRKKSIATTQARCIRAYRAAPKELSIWSCYRWTICRSPATLNLVPMTTTDPHGGSAKRIDICWVVMKSRIKKLGMTRRLRR